MNNFLILHKMQVLERLVLQDIVAGYSMKKESEASYDELMARLQDRIMRFYDEIQHDAIPLWKLNQYGNRADVYRKQLRADLDQAARATMGQIIKQLPREQLSGYTQWDVIWAVRLVLRRRMEVLSNLLMASTLQVWNYMLLWDYQDAGFTHYCLLTEDENCDDCNNVSGKIFPISEARLGENFVPMHPNCNCRAAILNDVGEIAYIISGGKAEKNENDTNWYDAFLRLPQDAKELFLTFVSSQNERLDRGDLSGFLDWLTMGTISGIWKGYQDRYEKQLNDPTLYNIVNYLTSGFADTVKGAINPEDALSLQHWLDSMGVVSTAFGVYQKGKSAAANMPQGKTGYVDDATEITRKKTTVVMDDITTGTVWDDIKPTQPIINGTGIPKSFEIIVDNKRFWVHPNGTKHMAEYILRNNASHRMPINSQTMLSSFQRAISSVIAQGIQYEKVIRIDTWELIFSQARGEGLLPVIKHALYILENVKGK